MGVTQIIVVALAVLVGLSLGLLGGGGSILVVPLLTYVGGFAPKDAIATSLFVVGATSLTGLVGHARKGNVRWRIAFAFGTAGLVGAFLGGLAGGHLPDTLLMIMFAVMMIATASAMVRGQRTGHGREGPKHRPLWRIALEGMAVGAVTGLVGAGGGFLIVPALALLVGLPMTAAVGTSLAVITMNTVGGFGGYLTSVSLNWTLVAAVTVAAMLGSMVGVRLTSRIPEAALRKGFGYFVLLMGAFVLSQELPFPGGPIVLGLTALLALSAALCRIAGIRCSLRSSTGEAPPSSHSDGATARGTPSSRAGP